ncbi:hypothetical protein [Streptomyces sp. NPDC046261]|uniref:hypothetical protein n=1 Tax=Streptomyces sp. NPDC046261 TaxID=3157200 RepID=UPI0033C1C922
MNGRRADAEESLVRIRDLAGRARGTGFLADDRGTLITSHEAVDGLARLVLHAAGELTCVVGVESVTPLPEFDLALVRTEGLSVPPLPVAAAVSFEGGQEVRLRTGRWHTARIVGDVPVTYTATDRFHLLGAALELSLSERAGLRLGDEATGGPVFDARTGAVVAVLGTALQADRRAAGFAIPLRAAAATAPDGPLAALLDRNSATIPAFGPDLNLAGALQLTATALGSVVTPRVWREPVERPETEREFARFLDVEPSGPGTGTCVLGLVGDPGTGRTTELGALAARRARGAEPAPTIWLRGADLQVGDESVRDAVARALAAAGRIVTASAGPGGTIGDTAAATPEGVAELARRMGRPLLVLLDGPEEMPPVLAHALPEWTAATTRWLRETSARLIVACRPEHWESAGALFPPQVLHTPGGSCAPPPAPGRRALPPCSRLPGLTPGQAAEVRASYGIPPEAIAPADAAHPLALRLLAEVRAALPDGTEGIGGSGEAAPDRWDVFAAYLDLICLRIAVRLAASRRPPLRGPAVRRLAARVAGQVHEAARRCLGPGQGELEREAFEELFPWRTGWASAVLTEGLLVPAGSGYRFAHEEFADWLQGTHLDLDAALYALVHRWYEPEGPPAEAAVRLPSRAGGGPMPAAEGHVPPPPGSGSARGAARRRKRGGAAPQEPPRPLPVPRHRIGPVLQALLLLARRSGPTELSRRLSALVHAVETLSQRAAAAEAKEAGGSRRISDPSWWAAHLLGEALLRVPDATPYMGVLRLLAERVTARSVAIGGFDSAASRTLGGLAEFGPWFWLRLPLGLAERLELLRILIPADAPPPGAAQEAATAALEAGPTTAADQHARPLDDVAEAHDAASPEDAPGARVPGRAENAGETGEADEVEGTGGGRRVPDWAEKAGGARVPGQGRSGAGADGSGAGDGADGTGRVRGSRAAGDGADGDAGARGSRAPRVPGQAAGPGETGVPWVPGKVGGPGDTGVPWVPGHTGGPGKAGVPWVPGQARGAEDESSGAAVPRGDRSADGSRGRGDSPQGSGAGRPGDSARVDGVGGVGRSGADRAGSSARAGGVGGAGRAGDSAWAGDAGQADGAGGAGRAGRVADSGQAGSFADADGVGEAGRSGAGRVEGSGGAGSSARVGDAGEGGRSGADRVGSPAWAGDAGGAGRSGTGRSGDSAQADGADEAGRSGADRAASSARARGVGGGGRAGDSAWAGDAAQADGAGEAGRAGRVGDPGQAGSFAGADGADEAGCSGADRAGSSARGGDAGEAGRSGAEPVGGSRQAGGAGDAEGGSWRRGRDTRDGATEGRRRGAREDGAAAGAASPADRFLTAVAAIMAEHPCAAQPLLCRWFTDERALQTVPVGGRVRPTVATAAQALLHTHRRRAIDDLAEALVEAGHPRADELLTALAEDEPSALCRAVDRWAHDDRVERHVAAAAYGLLTAPHVTTDADRELLRFSALALLARPAEGALHGTALALLVRDHDTRAKHLPQALARFSAGDPHLPPSVLAPALTTHPDLVLGAFQARLYEPGERPAAVLRTLAEVSAPATLARRIATLVREHVEHRPEGAENAASFVDRRLEDGPAARAVLFPLVVDLLRTCPAQVRRALAPVLADPGTPLSRPLRQELLEVLMEREEYGPYEREVTVLDALLRAVAAGAAERSEGRTRDLVHRTGLLMARTTEGAACFDRRLTQLAREIPVFGAQVRGWLKSAPAQWAVVVGPSARIRLTAGREKGGARGQGDGTDPADPADLAAGAPADAGRRQPAWHS